MKNAFITIILAIALAAFFGFSNNRAVSLQEEEDSQDNFSVADTVPAKKDTGHWKSKKTPYDSFGKPKKMDSARSGL